VTRWAVVLAGGVGTRFWPLSTQKRPKQLLPLVSKKPLLVQQLERLRPIADPERTLVLTNKSLVRAIARVAPEIPRKNVIAEPKPAGTAAALAWAAHLIEQREGRDTVMVSVHADWAIGNENRYRDALLVAAAAAELSQSLVTVGVVPTRPDPGFGYIEPGEKVLKGNVRRVKRFMEKPTREQAATLREQGYLWNSGIFAWRVGDFLDEIRQHAPGIASALAKHGKSMGAFFSAVKPIAVDHAVLERSNRVLVVTGNFGWDDVGTWGALQRVRGRDAQGNAVSGSVHVMDATNNVVHAEDQQVVLYGVHDLVVVAKDGLTLVTTVDRSADLKKLVESLPPKLRDAT
jgi:mannose-1-phosphate guanylyltransferase